MSGDTSAALLEGILETLKLIHGDIEAQDKRWRQLEERTNRIESRRRTAAADAPDGIIDDVQEASVNESDGPRPIPIAPTRASHGNIDWRDWDIASFIQPAELTPLPDHDNTSLSSSSGHSLTTGHSTQLQHTQQPPPAIESLRVIEGLHTWDREWRTTKADLVPIRDWKSPLADSLLYQNQTLQRELGDAWTIPDDNRLPIEFCRDTLEKVRPTELEYRISNLTAFRDRVKTDEFIDLKIIDNCSSLTGNDREGQMTYRLGLPARAEGICQVPSRPDVSTVAFPYSRNRIPDAPWRRFIFFQGIATLLPPSESDYWPVEPFISANSRKNWDFWHKAIVDHCECNRLYSNLFVNTREKANPYNDPEKAFHITFFEIIPSIRPNDKRFDQRGKWNHGPLYNAVDNEILAESAFTMIEIPGRPGTRIGDKPQLRNHPTWTVLLLSPPRFISRVWSKPTSMNGPMHSLALELITNCYERLATRWTALSVHLERLLDERSALMRPSDHDRLLWDDEGFTRSRKYFWAIHSLAEFGLSINDNIVQWQNYREARLEPLREAGLLDIIDKRRLGEIEKQCGTLRVIRTYFEDQLEATKALRDGLFNASAVIETRASTRLGENVKLLTFVSIFFLPIAFCTSLWSINNMFPLSTLIYTAIIVGLSTYLIVFNLNNLVHEISTLYNSLRSRLVDSMKAKEAESEFWFEMGNRFGVFKPQHEKASPSEWWLVLYLFRTGAMGALRLVFRPWAPEGYFEKEREQEESIERSISDASSIDLSLNDPVPATAPELNAPPPVADQNPVSNVREQAVNTAIPSSAQTTSEAPLTVPSNAIPEAEQANSTSQETTTQETRASTPLPVITPALPQPRPEVMTGESELISDSTAHLPRRHKRQDIARRTLSKMFRRKQTVQPALESEPV